MPENEIEFLRRKQDFENLSMIPKILINQENHSIILTEIKDKIKDYDIVKTDVGHLKFWHNKIVVGVLFSIISTGIMTVMYFIFQKG